MRLLLFPCLCRLAALWLGWWCGDRGCWRAKGSLRFGAIRVWVFGLPSSTEWTISFASSSRSYLLERAPILIRLARDGWFRLACSLLETHGLADVLHGLVGAAAGAGVAVPEDGVDVRRDGIRGRGGAPGWE